MSKDNNSKTLNNLVSINADKVEVSSELSIPVLTEFSVNNGT